MNKVIKEEFRLDGRKLNEIRKIEIKHKVINSTHYIHYSQGQTLLTCFISEFFSKHSVRDKLKASIHFQKTAVDEGQKIDSRIDEIEKLVSSIFEPYIISQCSFAVSIIITQDDGCLLSAIINTISILLAVNNISVLDFLIGVEITKIRGEIFFDPNKNERGGNRIILCRLVNRDTIGYVNFLGKMKNNDMLVLYAESIICSNLVYNEIKNFLTNLKEKFKLIEEF